MERQKMIVHLEDVLRSMKYVKFQLDIFRQRNEAREIDIAMAYQQLVIDALKEEQENNEA